jgi:hypothetical protein
MKRYSKSISSCIFSYRKQISASYRLEHLLATREPHVAHAAFLCSPTLDLGIRPIREQQQVSAVYGSLIHTISKRNDKQ